MARNARSRAEVPRLTFAFALAGLIGVGVQVLTRIRETAAPSALRITVRPCADPFYVHIKDSAETTASDGICFVRPPSDYQAPLPWPHSLWKVPRQSLGELNTSDPSYKLHVNLQRWAYMKEDYAIIRPEGGTSGRAFRNNFDYVQSLLKQITISPRCGSQHAPVMLDMGGGIGSVAAALVDEAGGSRAIRTITYVLPDTYLRQQAIISHRRLPSYLANFQKRVPFPDESLDIVHCKWCWHHLVGYDVWLREVSRVLVPGGTFVFTLSKGDDDLLEQPAWDQAVARHSFTCHRARRIMLICRKHVKVSKQKAPVRVRREYDFCPDEMKKALHEASIRLSSSWSAMMRQKAAVMVAIEREGGNNSSFSRVLNVNCPDAALCASLETPSLSTEVMHLSSDDDKGIAAELLSMRKLAVLHEWLWNIPVYPRSFDIVNVGCTAATSYLIDQPGFWVDVHRVLSPGGMAVIMRSFCDCNLVQGAEFVKELGFEITMARKHVVVMKRAEMR